MGDRRQTRCKWGHEYTPENTYRTPSGYRRCRTCHREKVVRDYHARETWSPERRATFEAARRRRIERARMMREEARRLNPPVPKPPRTHCPRGHALTPDNLALWLLRKGQRTCLICAREHGRVSVRAAEAAAIRKRRESVRVADPVYLPPDQAGGMCRVIPAVALAFDVDPAEVVGPRRYPELTRPRFAAAYLLRLSGLTLRDIGEALGGRDHSTVKHALREADRLKGDPDWRRAVEDAATLIAAPVAGWITPKRATEVA